MITALVMFKIKSTHFFTTIPANFLNGNVEDFDMCINIFHKNCEDRNCRIKAYKNSFTYRREVDLDAFFEDDSIKVIDYVKNAKRQRQRDEVEEEKVEEEKVQFNDILLFGQALKSIILKGEIIHSI
jgi:hypothetical protein